MDLHLLSEYWDDPAAKAAFQAFVLKIHGLDFSAWDNAGYWDDRYTPFSYFEGDRVVSSLCVYLLDAVIEGESTKLVQISGVGTAPEYRRRGLNRELTEIGLAWAAQHDPAGVFLFSDEGAIPFYITGGFEPIEEHVEVLELGSRVQSSPGNAASRRPAQASGGQPSTALRILDPTRAADRERIYQLAQRRAPVSQRFSVMNPKLLMFHCLYTLPHAIHEIGDLDCIVLASRAGSTLRIHDIIAERMPTWAQLSGYLLGEGDREVEFHFFVDQLELTSTAPRPLRGNHPFVRPGFPLAQPVFPYTSRA